MNKNQDDSILPFYPFHCHLLPHHRNLEPGGPRTAYRVRQVPRGLPRHQRAGRQAPPSLQRARQRGDHVPRDQKAADGGDSGRQWRDSVPRQHGVRHVFPGPRLHAAAGFFASAAATWTERLAAAAGTGLRVWDRATGGLVLG